ncbi:PaaI family thioesterase [Marinibaculum pumilum]|uniref:Medium/long-chain acyl-CoA thioesterase YigI n=1 Tax=Marinibaculum pumilum TaxID=1766165 RepID=A0ABV7L4U5_9PROT
MSPDTFGPADPGFETRVRDSFARQQVMRTLGVAMAALTPGRCELQMPFAPAFTQQHGFLHAGIVTTVADSAAGYAAYSLMPEDSSVLTVEFKQNLLAPAAGRLLIARAAVVRPGRQLSVVQSEAFVADAAGTEKAIALMQATMICLPGRPDRAA